MSLQPSSVSDPILANILHQYRQPHNPRRFFVLVSDIQKRPAKRVADIDLSEEERSVLKKPTLASAWQVQRLLTLANDLICVFASFLPLTDFLNVVVCDKHLWVILFKDTQTAKQKLISSVDSTKPLLSFSWPAALATTKWKRSTLLLPNEKVMDKFMSGEWLDRLQTCTSLSLGDLNDRYVDAVKFSTFLDALQFRSEESTILQNVRELRWFVVASQAPACDKHIERFVNNIQPQQDGARSKWLPNVVRFTILITSPNPVFWYNLLYKMPLEGLLFVCIPPKKPHGLDPSSESPFLPDSSLFSWSMSTSLLEIVFIHVAFTWNWFVGVCTHLSLLQHMKFVNCKLIDDHYINFLDDIDTPTFTTALESGFYLPQLQSLQFVSTNVCTGFNLAQWALTLKFTRQPAPLVTYTFPILDTKTTKVDIAALIAQHPLRAITFEPSPAAVKVAARASLRSLLPIPKKLATTSFPEKILDSPSR